MTTDSPNAVPVHRRRRWLQFSLRSLLLFTVICAVVAGWLGRFIVRKHRDREIVAALVRLGGSVRYDYQDANFRGEPPGPQWLRSLFGENLFSEVEEAGLDEATDSILALIGELKQLKTFRVNGHKVTDAGLAYVKGLTHLETLELWNTKITDAGLASLRGLHLKSLWLSDTAVTDVGLENLAGMSELQELRLDETMISDVGLKRIKTLNQLRELGIENTNVTKAGLNDLRKALPKCRINLSL